MRAAPPSMQAARAWECERARTRLSHGAYGRRAVEAKRLDRVQGTAARRSTAPIPTNGRRPGVYRRLYRLRAMAASSAVSEGVEGMRRTGSPVRSRERFLVFGAPDIQ